MLSQTADEEHEDEDEEDSLALIMVEKTGGVELVQRERIREDFLANFNSRRSPLLIVLIDPSRRLYEIMQLWIDKENDSVRDVLQSVRQTMHEKWRHDYDGLFQIRAGRPSQLIHVLGVQQYDVQPFEIWVAKPWAMAAKVAAQNTESLVDHLRSLEVVHVTVVDNGDEVVVLTQEARNRILHRETTLTHYHAKQFLSFSPPFERIRVAKRAGKASSLSAADNSGHSKSNSLVALNEDDAQTYSEESHEVMTVSSYSYLNASDPLILKKETKSTLTSSFDAVHPAEGQLDSRARKPAKSPQVQEMPNKTEKMKGSGGRRPMGQNGRLKGFVGSVSKLLSSNKCLATERAPQEELRNFDTKQQWDLRPFTDAKGEEESMVSRESSNAPLLQAFTQGDTSVPFRRNKIGPV